MKIKLMVMGLAALFVTTNADAQRFGGGFRSMPSFRSTPAVRSIPTSRPSYSRPAPYRAPANAYRSAPAPVRIAPFRVAPQMRYGGRSYFPVENGSYRFLFWYVILNNGQRRQYHIDCNHPRSPSEQATCQRAYRH